MFWGHDLATQADVEVPIPRKDFYEEPAVKEARRRCGIAFLALHPLPTP